jgi:thiamine biosynthesis lipoprotein ApbE
MMADALSTAMFIFGREKGEAFLKAHYPSAKAVWIGSKH